MEQTKCVEINITGDDVPESRESFLVQIETSMINEIVLSPDEVVVIIEGLYQW